MVERASASKRRVQAGWVAIILVLALVGAGCGSTTTDEGQADTTATTATTEAAPPALNRSELKAALLTPTDLGPGWDYAHYTSSGQDMHNAAEQSPRAVGRSPLPRRTVERLLRFDLVGRKLDERCDQRTGSATDPRRSTRGAIQEFQLIRNAFDSCLGQPWTSGSDVGNMEAITAPAIGDESAAYVTTITSPRSGSPGGVENSTRMTVLVRRGPVIEIYETGRTSRNSGDRDCRGRQGCVRSRRSSGDGDHHCSNPNHLDGLGRDRLQAHLRRGTGRHRQDVAERCCHPEHLADPVLQSSAGQC